VTCRRIKKLKSMGAFTAGTNGKKATSPRSALSARVTTVPLFSWQRRRQLPGMASPRALLQADPPGAFTLKIRAREEGWGRGPLKEEQKNPYGISAEALRKGTDLQTPAASLCFTGDLLLPPRLDSRKSLSLQRAAAGSPDILGSIYLNQFQNSRVAKVSKFEFICFKSLQPSPTEIKGQEKCCSHLKSSPDH